MNAIKRAVFRVLRDTFMLFPNPGYWLYWDAKLLKAREDSQHDA